MSPFYTQGWSGLGNVLHYHIKQAFPVTGLLFNLLFRLLHFLLYEGSHYGNPNMAYYA